ncbi:MAG: alpha/beta fold hydrolase [Silicimonas sp.]|nr:alpha/beta fold hydrolase [Silicimonas sp.]
MRWPDDATDWPLTEHSRIVNCAPHRWHVQEGGIGPTLLLIHGAGAATQSWRGLFPLLARHFHVVAFDLPGQGFTHLGNRARCGLDPMAHDIKHLMDHEGWQPDLLVGHSAGAAIALRLSEELGTAPPIVGINAALGNFKGVAGWLFPLTAKFLALAPFTAELFVATSTSQANITRLINGTGSKLPPEDLALYRRLARNRDHVDATLAMMAQWSLDDLLRRLPDIRSQTLFLAAEGDKAVPVRDSQNATNIMPNATCRILPDLGHLAHEEAPEICADLITDFATQTAVLS